MSDTNIIKSINLHNCPHCKGEIYIESFMSPTYINSVFTTKEMIEAKKDCISRIQSLAIDDSKKEEVIKWVNDAETIFAPTEVESIILSLLKPEE